ncbi:MAG: pyridoxamine 5'-phosphate oxidase family protein [Actinomycetota bacterium]
MELADVIAHSGRIGRIAYIATARADGRAHSAPVGIAWVDENLCTFVMQPSVKVTNARRDPRVHFHWQVGPESNNDSLIVEGLAEVVDTPSGRAELWDHMGYDLSEFEPGGPSSDGHVFLRVTPRRATVLYRFGFDGRDTWEAESVIDVRDRAGAELAE